jgi:nucleoside-diphosphate-sugar epimerase
VNPQEARYSLKEKAVLVTGGTGFIGRHLVPRLRTAGASVRVLVRKADGARAPAAEVEWVLGDLTDEASLREAVRGCQVVIHMAALLGDKFEPRSRFREVNVQGTRSLAEAALRSGVERFIHVSSVWAYGLVPSERIDETFPPRPSRTPYGDSKAECQETIERLCRERGLPAVIVQPGDVYGPEDQKWTLGPLDMMRSGKFTLVDHGKGVFQPVFVDDLAEGIVLAAERGRVGESYILTGEERTTFHEYFRQLGAIIGVHDLPSVPYWLAMTMASLAEGLARLTGTAPAFTRTGVRGTRRADGYSIQKARDALGFRPKTSLAEGIKLIEKRSR